MELLKQLYEAKGSIVEITTAYMNLEKAEKDSLSIDEEKEKLEEMSYFACFMYLIILAIGTIFSVWVAVRLGLGVLWILVVGVIGLFISTKIIDIIDKPFDKERMAKAKKYYDMNMPIAEKNITVAKNELATVCSMDKAQRMTALIPKDYASVTVMEFLIKAIENKRADSIKEAINLYEDHLHKQRLQEIQLEHLELSKQSNEIQEKHLEATEGLKELQARNLEAQKDQLSQTKKLKHATQFGNVVDIINNVHHWKK